MATLLKVPPGRGVVVFTTQERDKLIQPNKDLRRKIETLKPKWLIGLHHNWHDYAFKRDAIFDFSMAGVGDLVGDKTPMVELDACNFAPSHFKIDDSEKYWDVLYVARTVFFKRTNVFFNTVRKLFSSGNRHRILFIAPVNPSDNSANELFAQYSKFTRKEKDLLTLIAPQHDYPFPYDIETLAFFYRHSKIFAHFADEERRCRVIAYAWACGMPVVCRAHPASILPSQIRKPPQCYMAGNDAQFADKINEALSAWPDHKGQNKITRPYFAEEHTCEFLKKTLTEQFKIDQNNYNLSNLDIRLGRHLNIATGSNRIPMDIAQFIAYLHDTEKITKASINPDPEMTLSI